MEKESNHGDKRLLASQLNIFSTYTTGTRRIVYARYIRDTTIMKER